MRNLATTVVTVIAAAALFVGLALVALASRTALLAAQELLPAQQPLG
jgi:hypothetical protein